GVCPKFVGIWRGGPSNSVESSKKRKLGPVTNADAASDEGKSSLMSGSERPLRKILAHRLIIGYKAKKETAETVRKRGREDMLMESLEHRRILLRNVKAGRLAAERNLDVKLAGGCAWDSSSTPTLDTNTRLEREKAVFYDEMSAAAELDAPPRLCKIVRRSSTETDSDEDFELDQEGEDDSQSDDEDSVESEGLEGFDALASAAADEEPRIPVRRARFSWEERFNELVEFKKVHGHCHVKQRSKNNSALSRFVKKMREYKNKYDKQPHRRRVLTASRIARLDELGFVWSLRDKQHIKSFDDRMQELAAFKAEHGHADIPRSLEDNMSLAGWAHSVRQSYRLIQKGGKPVLALTKEMIERLEAIGFRLRVKERGKIKQVPFEERIKSLAEFKDVHGHVNVGEADDLRLGRFCNHMRVARRAPQPGVTMKLTQDRISALDDLGFDWEPRKHYKRRFRDKVTTQYDDEEVSADHRSNSTSSDTDTPSRISERILELKNYSDSDEDFELDQEDEDDSQSDDEDSVESEGLEGFDALASAAADAADEEPRIPVRRTRWESMWEEKFNELVEFKKVHGHCDVKQRCKSNTELGRFVKKMRECKNKYDKQQYNGSVLTPSRIARLDELGFTWRFENRQHIKSFDDRMQELAAFKAEHGHADIPGSLKDNMSLARWAHVVRQSYRQIQKGGKPALALTREMIERLEAIGFRLRVKERGKIKQVPFEERIKSLAEFKDVHGHVNVVEADDLRLARFCNHMRVARRNPHFGWTMKITQDRISALDALGFEWDPQKKKRRKARRDIMTAQYDDEEVSAVHRSNSTSSDMDTRRPISERILELKIYFDKHGKLPTPKSNKSLWRFCSKLRNNYENRKDRLSPQDLETLSEIGFRWGSKAASRLNELKLHFDEHGHFDVSTSENARLAKYVFSIRSAYNNRDVGGKKSAWKISDETISELESMGFTWEQSRPRRSPTKRRSFESRVADLKKFKQRHGHLHVTREEDQSLFNFCSHVRYGQNHPGKGMVMTEERVKALDEIGFSWTGNRGTRTEARNERNRKSFESRLADLRQYKQQHGHLNVKQEEDKSLYNFCQNVRTGRNKPGIGMKITDERIKALDEICFPWGGLRSSGPKVITFEERLDELRNYKHRHGHMNVRWSDDISLAAYCSKLRFARKTKKTTRLNLIDAKIAALDSIGFDWF
ncbi:hypothetical protein THAOC_20628, partial [Thalassiosira oceanica]